MAYLGLTCTVFIIINTCKRALNEIILITVACLTTIAIWYFLRPKAQSRGGLFGEGPVQGKGRKQTLFWA